MRPIERRGQQVRCLACQPALAKWRRLIRRRSRQRRRACRAAGGGLACRQILDAVADAVERDALAAVPAARSLRLAAAAAAAIASCRVCGASLAAVPAAGRLRLAVATVEGHPREAPQQVAGTPDWAANLPTEMVKKVYFKQGFCSQSAWTQMQ